MTVFRYPYQVPVPKGSDGSHAGIAEAPTEAVDYVMFKRTRIKYEHGGRDYYTNNISDQSNAVKDYTVGGGNVVYMAMPPSVSTSYQAGYSKVDAGVIGASALEAFAAGNMDSLVESVQKAASSALPEFTNAGVANIINGFGGIMGLQGQLDANSIQAMTRGKVFNPFSEQIFRTMGFRNHQFSFKLFSRNQREAEEVFRILKYLKEGTAPEIAGADGESLFDLISSGVTGSLEGDKWSPTPSKGANKGAWFDSGLGGGLLDSGKMGGGKRFFKIPDHFEIKFIRASETDTTWYNPASATGHGDYNKTSSMHFKIHPSFCTGISVNYTPDNQYTSFKRFNGAMVQVPVINLALQFVETRLISKADMGAGY